MVRSWSMARACAGEIDAGDNQIAAGVVSDAKRELGKVEARLETLRDRLVDQDFTREEYQKDKNRWLDEAARLRERIAKAETQVSVLEPLKTVEMVLNKAVSLLASADPYKKQEAVRSLLLEPVLLEKKVLVSAQKPFSFFVDRGVRPEMRRG